jgi:hypothetical protein
MKNTIKNASFDFIFRLLLCEKTYKLLPFGIIFNKTAQIYQQEKEATSCETASLINKKTYFIQKLIENSVPDWRFEPLSGLSDRDKTVIELVASPERAKCLSATGLQRTSEMSAFGNVE